MSDWVAIKTEYINTQISTRALAEKYDVSYATLRKRAEKEAWAQERKTQGRKVGAKVAQKTAEAVSSSQADRIVKLLQIGSHAADQLEKCLAAMDEDRNYRAYEIKAVVETALKIRELYDVSASEQQEGTQGDGLMQALDARAAQLFEGGDDSAMLPEEDDDETG